MTGTLEGQLNDGVLANLLQYLFMNRANGCLSVKHPQGAKGYIFLKDGAPEHISVGEPGQKGVTTDTKALSILLSWDAGRFSLDESVPSPIKTLTKSLHSVLLEASQYSDETLNEGKALLHADTVLKAKTLRHESDMVVLSIRALQLLSSLDGVRSLREIAQTIDADIHETVEVAQELFMQSLVEQDALLVEPAFIEKLSTIVVGLMGPVGEIVVEDALYECNLEPGRVPLRRLAEVELKVRESLTHANWQEPFSAQLKSLKSEYNISL